MTDQTGVALLVPARNAAAFLPKLANSAREQSPEFAEWICYDDASTDRTAEVAQELGFRVLEGGEHAGVSTARNRLAQATEQPWLHFHDADDLLLETFTSTLFPFCTSRTDIVGCDADWVSEEDGLPVITWRYNQDTLRKTPLAALIKTPMSLNNTIIRKSTFQKVKGCREDLTLWEDADFHVRAAAAGARFEHVESVLTIAVRRRETASHNDSAVWKTRLSLLEKYLQQFTDPEARTACFDELGRTAEILVRLQEWEDSDRAITIAERHGFLLPSSRNPFLVLLRDHLSPRLALRLQARIRDRREAKTQK